MLYSACDVSQKSRNSPVRGECQQKGIIMGNKYSGTQQIVGTAVLVALIVILQVIGSGIHFGPFTPTLSLVPIIIGAVLFGPVTGLGLGFVFSAIVLFSVISGADAGGAMMLTENPVATVLIVLLKGSLAGYFSGLVARAFSEKNLAIGVLLAAIVTPVTNTGIFCIGVLLFFKDLITSWGTAAGFENVFAYIIGGLVGVNFLVEVVIDLVLAPIIIRIIVAVKKVQ